MLLFVFFLVVAVVFFVLVFVSSLPSLLFLARFVSFPSCAVAFAFICCARFRSLVARCSLLVARCSMLVARCSMLVARRSSLVACSLGLGLGLRVPT